MTEWRAMTVRLPVDLHRELRVEALDDRTSANLIVLGAVRAELRRRAEIRERLRRRGSEGVGPTAWPGSDS